jgi:myo-inositol-1(or 4)-monophosphatase
LAYVAAGRFDAVCVTSWKHWDIAAGKLLVREAGGKITQVDEEGRELLFAANPSVHAKLVSSLTTPAGLKKAKII